ncbi:MAG: GxxExxY protein [Armatimonadetes bacterium]|nr:GxxExxY protein [Armatimonadota bacterium]
MGHSFLVAEHPGTYGADSPHAALTYRIIQADIEAHRRLGPGFLEAVYEEALCLELEARGISCERQKRIDLYYRGKLIGEYRLDLVVEGRVVVELKAVEELGPAHRAQALSYLRATGIQIALLLNFSKPTLKEGIQRVINKVDLTPSSAPSVSSEPLR